MGEQLCEAQVPNLSSLCEEVVALRYEICTLAESYTSIIPIIIPPILQP